jgi:hypothetical protein
MGPAGSPRVVLRERERERGRTGIALPVWLESEIKIRSD